MILWHYTCEHGHAKIQAQAAIILRPSPVTGWLWLTDLDGAPRKALGLTMNTIKCDRMAHRYLVTNAEALPWMAVRQFVDPQYRDALEGADGVMPRHWFVSFKPTPARYIPVGA